MNNRWNAEEKRGKGRHKWYRFQLRFSNFQLLLKIDKMLNTWSKSVPVRCIRFVNILDAFCFGVEIRDPTLQFVEIDPKKLDRIMDEAKAKQKFTVSPLVVAVCEAFSFCKGSSVFDTVGTGWRRRTTAKSLIHIVCISLGPIRLMRNDKAKAIALPFLLKSFIISKACRRTIDISWCPSIAGDRCGWQNLWWSRECHQEHLLSTWRCSLTFP